MPSLWTGIQILTKRVQRGLNDIVCNQVGPGTADDEPGSLFAHRDPNSALIILLLRGVILSRRLTGHKEHLQGLK